MNCRLAQFFNSVHKKDNNKLGAIGLPEKPTFWRLVIKILPFLQENYTIPQHIYAILKDIESISILRAISFIQHEYPTAQVISTSN